MRLSEKYDEWMITPLPNVVVFYSTEVKELICEANRSIIKEKTGVIKFTQDCYIETNRHIIRASPEKTSQARHIFKLDVDEKVILNKQMVQEKQFTYDLDATRSDEEEVESIAVLVSVAVLSILVTNIVSLGCYWKIYKVNIIQRTAESTEVTEGEDTLSMKELQQK